MINKLLRKQQRFPFAILFIYIFFYQGLIFTPSLLADTIVSIEIGGLIGSTSDSKNVLLAGSMGTIAVTILPSTNTEIASFNGFSIAKPDWLSLEFSYSNDGENFIAVTPELLSQINPQYFLDELQVGVNSVPDEWHELSDRSKRLVYYFSYQVPEELSGTRLCVHPILTAQVYGPITGVDDPSHSQSACITVVNPVSETDHNRVLTSRVMSANRTRNYEEAVRIADSLLETGWSSRKGLSAAKSAALKISDYDSALLFLDALYEKYDSPYPNLIPKDQRMSSYQSEREKILHLKSEQEQQHK